MLPQGDDDEGDEEGDDGDGNPPPFSAERPGLGLRPDAQGQGLGPGAEGQGPEDLARALLNAQQSPSASM